MHGRVLDAGRAKRDRAGGTLLLLVPAHPSLAAPFDRAVEHERRLFDRLVPVLRTLDALRLTVGLSLWVVARRFSAPTRS